jgi:outer membrane lipoprotein-sorting protein
VVTAADPDNPETGFIELTFAADPIALREWIIYDAAGGQTRVQLGEIETGLTLPSSLFDPDRERRQRNDR